ncbi:hypothetical protein ABVT39_007202 [Epinephelus coioides]
MADELARVRRKFVEKVSKVLIMQLLDDLLQDGILNDGQKDSIVEENNTTADKARVLIDTVKRKGDKASRKLIAHIHSRDSTLYSELGLSCVQPAQPAAVRLSEQEWSITLNPATESFWMDKVNDNNVYPVDKKSIKNRVALLITNIKFTDEKWNRNGADKDEENMEKLLTALKYEVVKYTNLTGKAIDDAILKFSKHPKLKETDSVIVVIMSHGKLGKVLGVDWKKGDEKPDEFLIDNIYKHLGSEKCPALLDKPKIIIIQACRGEEEGSAFVRDVVSDDASQSNLPPPADEDNLEADTVKCVHKEKDFTALLSCTPDTVSYRQKDLGSFLIQYIVEVFNTFAHKDDIEELFRRALQEWRAIRAQQDQECNETLLEDQEKEMKKLAYQAFEEKRQKDLDNIADEQEEPVSQSLSPVSQHQLGEPVDETDLQNILKKLVSKVDESFCPTSNQINVCRNNVLLCSLRAFKRRKFNPEAKLDVVFVDEDGNGEGAVDEGGPTREYLRLLMRAIHQSNIFEGHEKDRQLSLDTQALQTNLYTWVAKMIAVCVVHGGVGPHFFSERLFQQICGIPTSLANVDEVCDHTFRQQLIKIQEATTVQEANSAIAEAADSLSIIGALRHVSNLKEKDSLVQSAADFFVNGRMQTALDQFVEGFRTLGLLEELRENPAVFRSMFVSEERPLQAKDLFSLFGVDYSVQGSNKRAKENSTICYWRDWLIDIEEGECSPITLEKVLEFTSGASTVPPLGFPHRPQIHFIHEANRVFPEANTCLIILRLPIHSDYEDFRKYMEEGILQAPTFGVA